MPNFRLSPIPVTGLLALVVALAPYTAARASGIALLPHHAVYKLALVSSSGNKAPADASGMISYDFSGSACDGYKTVFRQVTSIEPAEGDTRVSNTETTTLESGNATRFGFDIRTSNNDSEDDVKGDASKTTTGSIAVDLQKPEAAQVDLKTEALFPTEHLSRIIASAEAGGKILSAAVYDGSDTGRKLYNTLSIIGAPVGTPATDPAAQDDALKGERRWPVTISYFEQGQDDAQPAYVLSFELYENGVSRAIKVDYGNFALAGQLVEFKAGASTPCAK